MEIWGTPFKILYIFFRVFARLLLAGKKKRDIFFKHTGWGRLDGFMNTFGLSSHLIFSHLVKQTHNIVNSPVFSHERAVSEFLSKQKGKLFVDVGANFGYYSFLLHDNFQEILAVEPHPFNLKVLTSYKQMYNYEKVKVVPLAVGNHSGQINLYLGKHSGGHSILEERMPKREHLTVNCETLSSIVEDRQVDLVKVDVEGAEWQVLSGAQPIMDKIKSWLIELHDLQRKKEMDERLSRYGYRTNWVDENHVYTWRD